MKSRCYKDRNTGRWSCYWHLPTPLLKFDHNGLLSQSLSSPSEAEETVRAALCDCLRLPGALTSLPSHAVYRKALIKVFELQLLWSFKYTFVCCVTESFGTILLPARIEFNWIWHVLYSSNETWNFIADSSPLWDSPWDKEREKERQNKKNHRGKKK